ncbi:hypothetical protein AB0J82_31170 [Asanoa sp. NPDC049518]|uniref:hypothetical protein n=1 Tax=unclassified Asanoa TaxID=2685164 RepID=UPI00341C5D2C
MLKQGRNKFGQLLVWRLGRRLAWRPRLPAPDGGDGGPFEIIVLAILAVLVIAHLLNWLAALLATAVIWPYQTVTGRWLVIAHVVSSTSRPTTMTAPVHIGDG